MTTLPTDSFASLAQIRVLLLPVGHIHQSTFEQWALAISSLVDIKLSDVPPSRDDRARFMPGPLASGSLHLTYTFHPPPQWHEPLSVIQLSHFPLGVIGIASASTDTHLPSLRAQFDAAVDDLFNSSSFYPLATDCIVFEEDGNASITDTYSGLVIVPSVLANKNVYLGTILATLCSGILSGFTDITRELESDQGNDMLHGSLFPLSSSLRDSMERTASPDQILFTNGDVNSRSVSPVPEAATSNLPRPSPSPLKRFSTGSTTPLSSRTSLNVAPVNKRRSSTMGPAVAVHYRLYKVLGDLFLLAGRTSDAAIWYNEAIQSFKTTGDNIWHASALEGLCTCLVLDAWHATTRSTAPQETLRKDLYSDLWEKLTIATSLYGRLGAWASGSPAEYSFATLLLIDCTLRHARLALAVFFSQGWNQDALQSIVTGQLPTPEGHGESFYHDLSEKSGLARTQIASILSLAHGPFLMHLHPHDCVSVLSAQASIYGMIGFERKEAFLLRELLAVIMDMVVCGRDERKLLGPNSNGPSIVVDFSSENHSDEELEAAMISPVLEALGIREVEDRQGNESVVQLVTYVCRIYGIDLASLEGAAGESTQAKAATRDGSHEILEQHGWPEIQVGVVREAVAIAEALPEQSAVALFSLSTLRALHEVLDPDDQQYLYETSIRAMNTARRRGEKSRIKFWLENPIVSVKLASSRAPIVAIRKHASGRTKSISAPSHGPFLYDPNATAEVDERTVMQDEPLDVLVELSNPFAFSCEIQRLALLSSGVRFDAKPVSALLPSLSTHVVRISGTPCESGALAITGCSIQLPGCDQVDFPFARDTKRQRVSLAIETSRTKYTGLASRRWEKDQKLQVFAAAQDKPNINPVPQAALSLNVVAPQPLLRIKRTSLSHGALMLYEGERVDIRLTVENTSSVAVNFMQLTFSDSTSTSLQELLSTDGELSAIDAYELARELRERPVFEYDLSSIPARLESGKKGTLAVSCLGKPACTDGKIRISYGNTSNSESGAIFFARRVEVPFLVTVYHILETASLEILPYSPTLSKALIPHDLTLPPNEDPNSWCIVALELVNTSSHTFNVSLRRIQQGVKTATSSALISPTCTQRLLLPLSRVHLPDSKTSIPIPASKQSMAPKQSQTATKPTLHNELFWYREALLASFAVDWQLENSTRRGELSLRQERMTLSMLEAFRAETFRIYLSYSPLGAKPGGQRQFRWKAKVNELSSLQIQLVNLHVSPVPFFLSVSLDPAEYVLLEGTPTQLRFEAIEQGGKRSLSLSACFVSTGTFYAKAVARQSESAQSPIICEACIAIDVHS